MDWLNMFLFHDYLNKPDKEYTYMVTTTSKPYQLGKVRVKIETTSGEHYSLTVLGTYSPTKVKPINSLSNVILDTTDFKSVGGHYLIPEDYSIVNAEEQLKSLLLNKEQEYILTDNNMFLNVKYNPISKVHILGVESNIVNLPVFKELVRTSTPNED